MTAPDPPTRPDDTSRKTDLRLARIAAAALAAVTTAVVSSRLGADGTLIGAAGASVVTTVATALYQTSLERSGQRVRSLTHRGRVGPSSDDRPLTEHPATADGLPDDGRLIAAPAPAPGHIRRFASMRWGAVAAGALGGFALAMMAITGFEWASGEAFGGNGKGTTIGQVVNDPPAHQEPTVTSAPPTPTSENWTETPTPTSEPPATSTPPPGGDADADQSPFTSTSERPTPSETRPPPLLPRLPGVGP